MREIKFQARKFTPAAADFFRSVNSWSKIKQAKLGMVFEVKQLGNEVTLDKNFSYCFGNDQTDKILIVENQSNFKLPQGFFQEVNDN